MTISELNDSLRRTFTGGKVVLTPGIRALSPETRRAVIDRVKSFHVFTEDNDPYGEHDFGCFDLADYTIAWKIDYLDLEYQFLSPNPADPAKTRRVLTILLTEEY